MSRTKNGNPDSHPHSTQTFPLAHPPPKSSKSFRLTSRLLLQIQQLSSSSKTPPRAVPVLELYQPSTFGKSIPNAPGRKLHSRDMYLTQSETYTHLRPQRRRNGHYLSVDETYGHGNGTTAATKPRSVSGSSRGTISSAAADSTADEEYEDGRDRKARTKRYAKAKEGREGEEEDSKSKPKPRLKAKNDGGDAPNPNPIDGPAPDAELYFPSSRITLEASSPAPGRYRFQMQPVEGESSGEGRGLLLEWERRPPSRSSPAVETDEGDRFILSVSERATSPLLSPSLHRRAIPVAQLTRRGVHVGSPGGEAWQRGLSALVGDVDGHGQGAGLYTAVLTMGVWIARAEGWLES
ncbi:hypothetical protein BJX61DRAFT_538306 [Aspergillus egyptiacus]|nr:hypothetical protein BJX61DRAFT_538306 [Aspergillus egyptiacus]